MKFIFNGYTSMARVWATNLLVLLKSMPDTWTFKEALNKYVMMPEQIMWRDSRGITLHEIRKLLIRISLEEEGMGLNEIQREDLDDWFSEVGRDIRSTTSREAGDCLALPDTLNTQKAQKAFVQAIAKGWMKQRPEGGFEWLGFGRNGYKAKLSYLCAEVYGYKYKSGMGNVGEKVPYEALEKLFDVTRLDRAMQQVFEADKPQRWRLLIDQAITE